MTIDEIIILAAAIIAAGMRANPEAKHWTQEEITNDAVETAIEIRKKLIL